MEVFVGYWLKSSALLTDKKDFGFQREMIYAKTLMNHAGENYVTQ